MTTVQGDARTIRGIATTPTTDRTGDIVEPLGVKFKNPLPLLWQHDTASPVGFAKFDKPTKAGIEFEAQLPTVEEPGALKDRVDEAWQSIKLGLVRGVSIGFRSLKHELIDERGIFRWYTISRKRSAGTLPRNTPATMDTPIAAIKAFDLLNARPGNRRLRNSDTARCSSSTSNRSNSA